MQDLIRIESRPAAVSVNFAELKVALEKELRRYEVVVTADTVGDAKKLATELNKTASMIDKRRKEEVASVSEPIRAFDDSMKELVTMCKDGRETLLNQVKRFEDETRETCRALLALKQQAMWDHHQVDEEYQRAEFDDLIQISNVTASGNLTAKARGELESRVLADKMAQDRTERRLLELRAKSLEAGLASALTRDHVTPFLASEDAVYEREVDRIIAAELHRQALAEERMRERLEREARQKVEAEQREKERQERAAAEAERSRIARAAAVESAQKAAESVQKAPEPAKQNLGGLPRDTQWEEPVVPASEGKVAITVTAEFRIEAPGDITDEVIEQSLRRQLAEAGIKSLAKVSIWRHRREAA